MRIVIAVIGLAFSFFAQPVSAQERPDDAVVLAALKKRLTMREGCSSYITIRNLVRKGGSQGQGGYATEFDLFFDIAAEHTLHQRPVVPYEKITITGCFKDPRVEGAPAWDWELVEAAQHRTEGARATVRGHIVLQRTKNGWRDPGRPLGLSIP